MRKFLLLPIGLFLTVISLYPNKIYNYKETTGNKEIKVTWKIIKETQDRIIVQAIKTGEKRLFLLHKKDGSTLKWGVIKKNNRFVAVRKENIIKVQIEKNGKKKQRILKIGQTPWIQTPEFGFLSLVKNKREKSKIFGIICPRDFSFHKMIANKEGEEEIKIGNKKYHTVKIKVTLKGWLSMFWHSYYWFRKNDGVFVKFEGVRGRPFTPKTITQLIEERN